MGRHRDSEETMESEREAERKAVAPMYASTWFALFVLLRESLLQQRADSEAGA